MKNVLFPGRKHYIGPTQGWFGFLHHEQLCEYSHDVNERIEYVKKKKPKNEIAIRLHNMIYLGECEALPEFAFLVIDYGTKRDALSEDYGVIFHNLYHDREIKCQALLAHYETKPGALFASYKIERDALWTDYETKYHTSQVAYVTKLNALDADYKVRRAPAVVSILAYIKQHIPDYAWDGTKLCF